MKVKYSPAGGRFGYGFNYFCADCGAYLGNSLDELTLLHPSTESITVPVGLFRNKTEEVPISCPNAGKKLVMPIHTIEVEPCSSES